MIGAGVGAGQPGWSGSAGVSLQGHSRSDWGGVFLGLLGFLNWGELEGGGRWVEVV